VTHRQRSLRLPRLTQQQRTPLRSLQALLAQPRPATRLRTIRPVLRGLLEPLRLRTIRAVALLTARQPRTTLAVQQGQVRVRQRHTPQPMELVGALVEQQQLVTRLLTVRRVEHLAQQPKQLVTQLATLHPGQLRLVSHLLVRMQIQARTTGLTGGLLDGITCRLQRVKLGLLTQPEAGLITRAVCSVQQNILITTESTDNKPAAIHAQRPAQQAKALIRLRAGLLTSTPRAGRPKLRLRAGLLTSTPRVGRPKLRLRHTTQRLRLVRVSLQLRLTRLRLAHQKLLQRHLIQRLRLVHHTERVTARPLRLTLTLRGLLTI